MMTLFARGIAQCSSTVVATLLNTAANLGLTGVVGHLFFKEPLDLAWWTGSVLVVIGGALVLSDKDEESDKGHLRSE